MLKKSKQIIIDRLQTAITNNEDVSFVIKKDSILSDVKFQLTNTNLNPSKVNTVISGTEITIKDNENSVKFDFDEVIETRFEDDATAVLVFKGITITIYFWNDLLNLNHES